MIANTPETINEKDIILYPTAESVFEDPTLAPYFRPLMTVPLLRDNKHYAIHLLGTDGLYCETAIKYAENNFFGFTYNEGKYRFLGDLSVFKDHEKVPGLYTFLRTDFEQQKDFYLAHKIKVDAYLSELSPRLKAISTFDDDEDAAHYATAFYSYELTRYAYQKTDTHQHISVLTENYGKNNRSFLLSDSDTSTIMEEFFMNMKYTLQNGYDMNEAMFCCGTSLSRFMSIIRGGTALALLDQDKDIVYLLEYS